MSKLVWYFLVLILLFGVVISSKGQFVAQIDSLNEWSINYRDIDKDTAILLGKSAVDLSREHGLTEKEYASLVNLCITCYSNHEFHKSILYCGEAIRFEGVDRDSKIQTYVWHGMSHVHLGFYNEAISSFLSYLEIANEKNDPAAIADALANLGLAYLNDGNTPKAAEYYRASLRINQKLNSPITLAYSYQNYARVMMAVAKFDSAEFYFDSALEIADSIKFDNVKYWVYAYKQQLPNYSVEQIIDLRQKALVIAKKENMGHEIAAMNYGLAEILIESGKTEKAIPYGEEAIKFGIKMESYGLVLRTYNLMTRAMVNLGQVDKSNFYLSRYEFLKDSLSEYDLTTFESIMGANELLTQEREIEQIKDKLTASQAVIRQNQLLIAAALIFILLIGVILFMNIKANKMKNKVNMKLNLLNEKLDASMKDKDTLTGMIVHDIRSPFNKIEALMQLFEMDGDVNENQEDIMQTMMAVINDSRTLTNDLLEINKIESGRVLNEPEQFEIRTFINELLIDAQNSAKRKKIELEILFDLENETVVSHKYILQRIIENLVSNAIKYTPTDGEIKLSIRLKNRMLTLSVADNGPGIPEAEHAMLFKKFGRTSVKPSGGESSTGLGLYIVDTLTKSLNGGVSFKSQKDTGTEFRVEVPVSG